MKKTIFLCLLCFGAITTTAQTSMYVDLGLPSGTIWSKVNEKGLFSYNEAVSKFGNQLPTSAQIGELMEVCILKWTGNGYNITGPNGNSIFLPITGYCEAGEYPTDVKSGGYYWSSTPGDTDEQALLLGFGEISFITYFYYQSLQVAVRLVK